MNLSALRLLSAAVLLAVLTTCTAAKPKLVTVNLDAKWPSTPMLLEASEFLAKENNEAFWSFVNSLVDLEPASYTDISDEEMYALLQKLAAPSLTPLQQSLLKFSLSMRSHSPTVQVHQQVALDKVPPGDCEVFIDINNMVTCEMEAFKAFLAVATKQAPPALLKKDHHYPGSQAHPTIVILYANIMRPSFREWHAMLKSLATEGNINYVLRHYNKDPSPQKVRLSGYGVELAIKSTEYKAQDDTKVEDEAGSAADQEDKEDVVKGFVFSKLQDLHPQLKDNLRDFRLHLVDSSSEMAPLKVWQLQDLSFQAAQRVISAPPEDQLRLLSDISQNFPLRARSMIRTVVSEKTRHDVMRNQGTLESKFGIPAGESVLFINGLQADPEIYDVFQLLDTMRSEARLMEGLYNLAGQYDLEGHKLMDLLKIDLREKEANYAIDVRDDAVQYINNMETDKKYSQWPKSVKELLRPTFPGMLRHIAKNLFHMVFIIDPLEKSSKSLIKMAEAFYVHSAPTRIGIVLVVNQDETVDGHTDAGVAILRAFNFIRKTIGSAKALSFLTDIYDRVQEGDITAEFVTTEFLADHAVTSDMVFGSDTEYDDHRVVTQTRADEKPTPKSVIRVIEERFHTFNIKKVLGPNSKFDDGRQGGAALLARTGLGVLPQVLLNGIPLRREELGEDEFEEAVVGAILKQTQDLQKAVYNGELDDSMDLLDHIMDAPNVMPRLNYRVLTDSDKHLDFSRHLGGGVVGNPASFKALSPADMTGAIASSLKYLTKKDEAMLRPVTIWVVGDLDTAEGRDLVYEAIKNLKNTNVVRLGLIHNPTDIKDNMADSIAMATQVAMETQLTSMSKSFVTKLMKEENVAALASKEKTLEDLSVHGDEDEPPENMDYAGYAAALAAAGGEVLHSHRAFSEQTLGLAPGQRAIICNGKVIGPLNVGERFIQEDFELLEKYTFKSSASKLEPKLKPLALKTDSASELAMRVLGVLTATSQKEPRKEISVVGTHSVIDLPPRDPTQPAYDIVAVLDPTTRAAQKYTPLMMVIQSVVNVRVRVIFNCREKLSEMPLKSFYRYVLEPELRFAVDSSLSSGPIARFQDLPQSSLLTLGMNPPESWLVEAIRAPYDLDNIRLEEADGSVTADFELEHLLLEGHCYDSASGQPPRGLQFILGTSATPAQVDTIVMANLGYFQLKAAPGMWHLKLRSGRSREIYQISSHEYTDSPPDSPDVVVVIDSFTSKIIRVRVHKQAGHEQDDLLGGEEPTPGLWDSFSSQFTGGTKEGQEGEKDETLNIFSLASGHLYERLLRIMMVSVLRHTQSKVKFWFLKNYLSPSFKDFIPSMAKQYNFEYELVQYKWPRWLHQQSEKQRIIWGYKILFLDVLFPLNINKIIFVDADQIVRTDLQELADFDLEGAPYGYTPFCDSRKEMDGFRFWNSGYWQGHLAGRKYHISALYVVDLKKFRKIAAGDRLRGQYQGLSQDPNSLSNLDQDLPNNMIHQVAIKSLPQEWLWCETWCSDSGLKTAKTIDLCNNPLTKEPKLTAAQRIVPEWIEYDTEIKDLWDQKYRRSGTEADNKSSTDSTDKKDEL